MSINPKRYVVINGDDFGYSDAVNEAIITAHQQGILTSTSLMVTAEKASEAVKLAKQNPHLGVGLHLVLCCGKSVLSPQQIPNLVDRYGNFNNNPAIAGLQYQFIPQAKEELRQEIKAQLQLFNETGLELSHVDGHLHLHCHPLVLTILAELTEEFQIKYIRLPDEELNYSIKKKQRKILLKVAYNIIFNLLKKQGKRIFKNYPIKILDKVYGLLETGNINEDYLIELIPQIKAHNIEIYSHPQSIKDDREFAALCSQKVKEMFVNKGFEIVNYLGIGEQLNNC